MLHASGKLGVGGRVRLQGNAQLSKERMYAQEMVLAMDSMGPKDVSN